MILPSVSTTNALITLSMFWNLGAMWDGQGRGKGAESARGKEAKGGLSATQG